MALRAGYQGFKKLLPGLKLFRPGCLGIDNSELSKTFFPRSEQAVSGVVNYLDPAKLKATASGSSVTATKQSDGSMALSGTASASSGIQLNQTEYVLPDGEWTFSLGREIGCKVIGWAGGDTYQTLVDSDTGKATFTASSTYIGYYVQMKVVNGTAYSGYIYPMFSLDPDAAFVPYAMTNSELSEIKTGALTGTISGATIGEESKYRTIGKVCWVYVRISLTESLQQDGRIAISNSNLPKNTLGSGFVFSNVFNQPGDIAWLDTDTKITFQHNGSNALSSGDVIQFSFCYPIA